MRVLLVVFLTCAAAVLVALEQKKAATATPMKFPPRFALLGTATGTGATSMECKGEPPFSEIECDFVQVGIYRQDDDDYKKHRAELQQTLEAKSETDLLKEIAITRTMLAHADDLLKEQTETSAPERSGYLKRSLAQLRELSACNTKACAVSVMLKQEDENRNTCKIGTNTFSSTFKRVDEHKWVSSPGPQGLCKVVFVQTLENEADYENLWTFTQTNVTADKSPPCKGIQLQKPIVYSWHERDPLLMDCRLIEFIPI